MAFAVAGSAGLVALLVVIVWVILVLVNGGDGPPRPGEAVPPFERQRCHNEGNFLVCAGPCAPATGRSCVTIVIDPTGTTRTHCVSGPFRYPWIKTVPGSGTTQQGWGACLF